MVVSIQTQIDILGQISIDALKRAFTNVGWDLDSNGRLGPQVLSDIESPQRRPVIQIQIDRMRNAPRDSALLIGTAKEMLETTGRYVLDELGQPARSNAEFSEVLHLARERLGLLPMQIDDSQKGLKKVYQSLWSLAESVNELRNEEGTGHGRASETDIPPYAARSVVQAASIMAQLMITRLDESHGR
jgi:hypothetical protein